MKNTSTMKKPAATLLSTLILAAFGSTAHAQEAQKADAAKKDEAVIPVVTITTGNRTAKAVDKIPGAVTVISKEDVAYTLSLTEDATAVLARAVPGYAESSQAMSNTGETLRGRIALRLFDGVPQTSPLREGGRSATFTDMGIVGRVEVINGPSAAEGIGASGGIINYISKSPAKMGSETTLNSRFSTQGHPDSASWKLGLNFAHKESAYDLLMSTSFIERGMTYDGNGRAIGLNTSGSVADSKAQNLFVKGGINFGAGNEQRLAVSAARFNITGNGNYVLKDGDRAKGITNTSVAGTPLGAKTEINNFDQFTAAYTHENLAGGTFMTQFYRANQQMRYPSEDGSDRQDPLIAPLGTLIDQSEIYSSKRGVRTSWTRPDLLDIRGLELRTGVDIVQDETQQLLALTGRLWVPPMLYKSTAPYAQFSYDAGPLTLSAGVRREDGKLTVDSYTTTYFRNRVQVQGGTLEYTATLPNYGVVWRVAPEWSVFGSVSKGFSLPNVGIPLRNVNKPGQSVQGILDLQAIIVDNKEVGFNWRGARGAFGASVYDSDSKLGVSLAIDPVSNDFIMRRQPVNIKGFEASGEWNLTKDVKVGALYSTITGKTVFVDNGPLDKEMGVLDINPDKFGAFVSWKFSDRGDMRLGATTMMSRDLNVGKSGEEHTTGYTLFDLGVNYDLKKYGQLTVGIENLLDRQYILSWSQLEGYRNYWAGRGRSISVSHNIKF